MAQIGNDAKPMKLTPNRIGKGSKPRPMTVSKEQYATNYDKIFRKKNKK